MFNIDGHSIEITRGDTGGFTITFTGQDAPEDGSIVQVSLKKTKTSKDLIWEKKYVVSESQVTVIILQDDTNDLSFGEYWWDARILFRDGTVYTPMKCASFKVMEVIGSGK